MFVLLAAALTLPQALDVARSSRTLVLADFEAPWCYSCYYMERNVLSRPAFQAASAGLALAKVDVDTPEGRALKARYAVAYLPTYLLIDASGKERGRLVGERTEADFLAQLARLRAGAGDRIEQALGDLRQLLAQRRYAQAERFAAALPRETRVAVEYHPDWKALTARAKYRGALERKKFAAAQEALVALLLADSSCDTVYDISDAGVFVETLYPESRTAMLRMFQPRLEQFLAVPDTCADERTVASALAETYSKLDEPAKKAPLFAKLAERLEKKGKTGDDRNRDDNLRFYLQEAGDDKRLRAHFEELVKAYPQDYVYAHRYARWLAEKGEHEAALPWAELADKLSYGANRLGVTRVRATVLSKLGREDEARLLLKRDIKAGAAVFPVETKALEELLSTLN
jgi:thioredoxin-like negative regulator of GroEL